MWQTAVPVVSAGTACVWQGLMAGSGIGESLAACSLEIPDDLEVV